MRTQTPQTEQCHARGGCTASHTAQNSHFCRIVDGRITCRVDVSVSHSPMKFPTTFTRNWRVKNVFNLLH